MDITGGLTVFILDGKSCNISHKVSHIDNLHCKVTRSTSVHAIIIMSLLYYLIENGML